jgi:hypothetical protein
VTGTTEVKGTRLDARLRIQPPVGTYNPAVKIGFFSSILVPNVHFMDSPGDLRELAKAHGFRYNREIPCDRLSVET